MTSRYNPSNGGINTAGASDDAGPTRGQTASGDDPSTEGGSIVGPAWRSTGGGHGSGWVMMPTASTFGGRRVAYRDNIDRLVEFEGKYDPNDLFEMD